MTPLSPENLDALPSYFASKPMINTIDLDFNPGKRLRSCLSPTRTPTGSSTPSRATGSRATSFSSDNGSISVGGLRGTKSVRFDETQEGDAVTSYHSTWSAAEYDRTPLPPPSAAERTCVLPERGSRTFSTTYDCFDDCPTPSFGSIASDETSPDDLPSSPAEEITDESLFLSSSLSKTQEEYPAGEDDDEGDREWEVCMERRRMMFALRTRSDEHERQPEFEGYRSISAKLADMLRSIEARREPSPLEDEEEDEEDEERPSAVEESEDEEEDDETSNYRPFSTFTFTNLQSLNLRSTPLDNVVEEGTEEDGSEIDLEAATPSLISSTESEVDTSLISPRTAIAPYPTLIGGLPAIPFALNTKESGMVGPA